MTPIYQRLQPTRGAPHFGDWAGRLYFTQGHKGTRPWTNYLLRSKKRKGRYLEFLLDTFFEISKRRSTGKQVLVKVGLVGV
jgi:hypothetical protein